MTKIELETYGEEEKPKKKSLLGKMWQNTVGRKLEEKREMDSIEREAKLEARDQIKEAIKKRLIKEELEKASKPKKNLLQTLSNELQAIPATDDKMDRLLGKRGKSSTLERVGGNLGFDKSGKKLNTDIIGTIPNIQSGSIMANQKFPRAKVETLNIQRDKMNEKLKKALGR